MPAIADEIGALAMLLVAVLVVAGFALGQIKPKIKPPVTPPSQVTPPGKTNPYPIVPLPSPEKKGK